MVFTLVVFFKFDLIYILKISDPNACLCVCMYLSIYKNPIIFYSLPAYNTDFHTVYAMSWVLADRSPQSATSTFFNKVLCHLIDIILLFLNCSLDKQQNVEEFAVHFVYKIILGTILHFFVWMSQFAN